METDSSLCVQSDAPDEHVVESIHRRLCHEHSAAASEIEQVI